jgi:nitroreductase
MVRLAPSASNKQPWRVVQQEGRFHFFLQRTKNYPSPVFNQILKLSDLQRIDIGIAMSHFQLSLTAVGLMGKWIFSDPELPHHDPGNEYIITWQPIS